MSEHGDSAAWRVLCVDDDEGVRMVYSRLFTREGWSATLCDSGEAAIECLQREYFDLVILDVIMPGIGGLDICKLLRESPVKGPRPAVFLVSGAGHEDAIERGFSSGADDYLVKPFQPAELLTKAKRCLLARSQPKPVEPRDAIVAGSIFAGRYQIEDELAAGGYSVVFRAYDPISERTAAIKLYDLPLAARSGRMSAGFLREAYQLSRLQHPNIVELYDFGQAQGFFYLAMEFVDGYTLEDTIVRRGILDIPLLALIANEIVEAIAAMAAQGLIHRDIKPANIMITRQGDIKILDFGLARARNEGTLSLGDEFQGTPQFVSPEMIHGEAVLDERSDLYSLGATLYYAATGVTPFNGNSNYEILEKHLSYTPPPVSELRPDFDPEFSNLIEELLAVDPTARPDCAHVLKTLINIFEFND